VRGTEHTEASKAAIPTCTQNPPIMNTTNVLLSGCLRIRFHEEERYNDDQDYIHKQKQSKEFR
jgi:hypothetical protein